MIIQKHIALTLFLFALLIRLVALGATYQGADTVKYWENVKIAINLLEGRGYAIDSSLRNDAYNDKFLLDPEITIPRSTRIRPTAFKPPVYTFVVALIFLVSGIKNFLALFVVHAVLSALTCLMLFKTLEPYSKKMAVLASFGVAVYPSFIYHSVTTPENTTLSLLLMVLFLFCLVKLRDNPTPKKWMISGCVSAILALTEVVAIPFMILALLYTAFLLKKPKMEKLKGTVIYFTAFAVLLAPWLIRNYLTFNHVFLLKSSAGHIMLVGLYNAGKSILIDNKTFQALEFKGRWKNEADEDKAIQKELLNCILKNKRTFLFVIMPQNFRYLWWEDKKYEGNKSQNYLLGRKIPYLTLLLLALPYLCWNLKALITRPITSGRENCVNNASLFLIITLTVVYSIFGATRLRYHFPIELVLFIFGAGTLEWMHRAIKGFLQTRSNYIQAYQPLMSKAKSELGQNVARGK